MKTPNAALVLLLGSLLGARAQVPMTATPQANVPAPTDYQIVQSDGNSRVWQRETYEAGPNGGISTNLQKYTELALGLNHLVNSQWIPSQEDIEIQPDGTASATNGQHQVFFPANILEGQIELITPTGRNLKSQPAALSYDDGSNTVLIAVLTNSIGQIINGNQVIYTNAFVGIDADLLYTFTRQGFEQDVVLNAQPPTPASLGLNETTARLQLLTEFFDPPQPVLVTNSVTIATGETLSDSTLEFGSMQMVPGRAFLMDTNSPSVRVCKSWVTLDGRKFLVEEVPVPALSDDLESLPAGPAVTAMGKLRMASRNRLLPPQHLVKNNHAFKMARAGTRSKTGLVLDYSTINSSLTNYTFQGDVTYNLSGNVSLFGTNTFEGGTVLKYTSGVGLNVYGSQINWEAGPYRPVIFTAKDDNYDGQVLPGSTGSPSGYYASPALGLNSGPNPTLTNFRIKYAKQGIATTFTSLTNYDGQIIDCQNGLVINASGPNVYVDLGNVLFAGVLTNFVNNNSASLYAAVQNTTISGANCLCKGGGVLYLYFTNCVVANLTNVYASGTTYRIYGANDCSYSPAGTVSIFSDVTTVYPFQAVGSGSYYLASGSSCHNAGTTNIDPALLADLANETTYPPIVYSGVTLAAPTTLSPQVQRDNTGAPDLGYHYDPLDYVFGGCTLTTNLTVNAGSAVGWYENIAGIDLNNGANVTFNGTATAPCWMARYAMVQENVNIVWPGRNVYGGLYYTGGGSGLAPQVNANFTKWSVEGGDFGHIRDAGAAGTGTFKNCEFYIANIQNSGLTSLYFTNCLFYRIAIFLFDEDSVPTFALDNCTWYNGIFAGARLSSQTPKLWSIENTSIDGTGFEFNDYWTNNSSYTLYNYNAYNTNNLSGLTIPYPYGATAMFLPIFGANSVMVTNYNWQSSWFGNFYLPPNSPLINAGSTNANLLGLYHFTTQTNQAVEGDSIVEIGYHYVATDAYGIPLDSNGDGIADYLEDVNGNGMFDSGDLGDWQISPYGLTSGSALQVFTPLK